LEKPPSFIRAFPFRFEETNGFFFRAKLFGSNNDGFDSTLPAASVSTKDTRLPSHTPIPIVGAYAVVHAVPIPTKSDVYAADPTIPNVISANDATVSNGLALASS
jgi:hypothetical protein